jgi:hypothetical protein
LALADQQPPILALNYNGNNLDTHAISLANFGESDGEFRAPATSVGGRGESRHDNKDATTDGGHIFTSIS